MKITWPRDWRRAGSAETLQPVGVAAKGNDLVNRRGKQTSHGRTNFARGACHQYIAHDHSTCRWALPKRTRPLSFCSSIHGRCALLGPAWKAATTPAVTCISRGDGCSVTGVNGTATLPWRGQACCPAKTSTRELGCAN